MSGHLSLVRKLTELTLHLKGVKDDPQDKKRRKLFFPLHKISVFLLEI